MPFPCCFSSKAYGITISELDQPLLIHRPKEKRTPERKVSQAWRPGEEKLETYSLFSALPAPVLPVAGRAGACSPLGVLTVPVLLPAASAGRDTACARAHLHDRGPRDKEGQSNGEGQSMFAWSEA